MNPEIYTIENYLYRAIYSYIKLNFTPSPPRKMLMGIYNISQALHIKYCPIIETFENINSKNELTTLQKFTLEYFINKHPGAINNKLELAKLPGFPTYKLSAQEQMLHKREYQIPDDEEVELREFVKIDIGVHLSEKSFQFVKAIFIDYHKENILYYHQIRLHIWQIFLRLTAPLQVFQKLTSPPQSSLDFEIYRCFISSIVIALKFQLDTERLFTSDLNEVFLSGRIYCFYDTAAIEKEIKRHLKFLNWKIQDNIHTPEILQSHYKQIQEYGETALYFLTKNHISEVEKNIEYEALQKQISDYKKVLLFSRDEKLLNDLSPLKKQHRRNLSI